ncbi:helix-turn-helix domain-containing protein [Senegalia massiliensis]
MHVKDPHSIHKDKRLLAKHKILNIEWYINNYSDLSENTLGKRIRKVRLQKNMTQKDLASKCKLSSDTICNIESERIKNPSIKTINKISTMLCTTNKYLLNLNNCNYNKIKKFRLEKGYTQRELASLLGIHQSTLTDYESGKIKTNKNILNNLCNIL